jgi:hypothetical protein
MQPFHAAKSPFHWIILVFMVAMGPFHCSMKSFRRAIKLFH